MTVPHSCGSAREPTSKRARNYRRVLTWTSSGACLLVLAVALSTLRFVYVWPFDCANCFVTIGDGSIVLCWPVEYFSVLNGPQASASVFVQYMSAIEKPVPGRLVDWPLLPNTAVYNGLHYIVVPLWIPFVGFGIASDLL